jgi:hypothetical protein
VTAGISAGDHDAGNTGPTATHSSVVTDGSKFFTLSANHVYADENTENIGNELVQPGDADLPADQDPSEFVFARLSDFNVIRFNVESFINPNVIDVGLARGTTTGFAQTGFDGESLAPGEPSSVIFNLSREVSITSLRCAEERQLPKQGVDELQQGHVRCRNVQRRVTGLLGRTRPAVPS